jgi:hypothetical protein
MPELWFPEIDFTIDPVPCHYERLADVRAKHRVATLVGSVARLAAGDV